jgi:hypothetical protein
MGVAGLLPALKGIARTVKLEELAGARVGVCGHAWLHAIGAVYAHEVLEHHNTTSLIRVFVRRCCWLRDIGIAVIVSFDGAQLPGKLLTSQKRAEKRKAAWLELDTETDPLQRERLSQVAFAITDYLIRDVINALTAEGIQYIRAPYETDGQLTYLAREGYVDHLLVNDSEPSGRVKRHRAAGRNSAERDESDPRHLEDQNQDQIYSSSFIERLSSLVYFMNVGKKS